MLCRRPFGFSVVLVLALTFAACSPDDDPQEQAGTATTAPTSPATDEPSPSDTSSATGVAEPPSQDDLDAALLTLADMPAGWSELPSEPDEDALCGLDMTALLGQAESELPRAAVRFALDAEDGPSVAEGIGIAPAGTAPSLLAGLRTALTDCEGEEVSGIPLTVAPLDLPTLAEDSAAFEIHLGSNDGPGTGFPLVYAISGDLVIGVYAFDLGGGDSIPMLEQYATLAVDRAVDALS